MQSLITTLLPKIIMKRQKPLPPTPTTPPPSPQQTLIKTLIPKSHSSKKPKRTLLPDLLNPQFLPLPIPKSELSLPLTFPTGQTFRWKLTDQGRNSDPAKQNPVHSNQENYGISHRVKSKDISTLLSNSGSAPVIGPVIQYTGPIGPHLISLKQNQDGEIFYCIHHTNSCFDDARLDLMDFLNLGICLGDLWEEFSASDSRFGELSRVLGGARVLRQDPFECLIQFICSSNNNIGRITQMVDYLSSLGRYLGSVEGFDFHEFPSLERLLMVSEGELRDAGFGYRAKYITGTVDALQSKPGGGVEWLTSLHKLDLQSAIDALSTLPGVGPKVAACVALFSLDQHHAIPVDTHVWKIATRYLIPELAGATLTPKLHSLVADAFVSKYGKYAGWAQTLLFIAELPSQKALLPSMVSSIKEKKPSKRKKGKTEEKDP